MNLQTFWFYSVLGPNNSNIKTRHTTRMVCSEATERQSAVFILAPLDQEGIVIAGGDEVSRPDAPRSRWVFWEGQPPGGNYFDNFCENQLTKFRAV